MLHLLAPLRRAQPALCCAKAVRSSTVDLVVPVPPTRFMARLTCCLHPPTCWNSHLDSGFPAENTIHVSQTSCCKVNKDKIEHSVQPGECKSVFFSVPAPRRGRRWHAWLFLNLQYMTPPTLECEAGILRAVASVAHHHCRHCMSEVSCDSVGEFLQPLLRVEIVHCVSVQQAVWAIQGNSIVQCPKDFSTLFCLSQISLSCSSCILGIWVQFYFHFHRAFPDGRTLTLQKHWIYFYYSFHRATDLSGIPLLRRE